MMENVPEEMVATFTKDEGLLICQLLVAVGSRDPKAEVAKAAFTKMIRAMQDARAALSTAEGRPE
jgi:hypothetical protein